MGDLAFSANQRTKQKTDSNTLCFLPFSPVPWEPASDLPERSLISVGRSICYYLGN